MRKRISLFFLLFILVACSEPRLTKRTYTGLGTIIHITVPRDYEQFADSAYRMIQLVDSLMNPNKPTSDVAKINRESGKWVLVSPLTAECIKRAIEIAEVTKGAFDPTVGKIVHLYHFDKAGEYTLPDSAELLSDLKYVDYRRVEVSGDSVKIGEGQWITLAGIAKGFAVDLASKKLAELGVPEFIVEAGGDLRVSGFRKGAKIGIRDPHNVGLWGVMKVSNGAVCTSGDYERYFIYKGVKYSHILDPRTGMPARGAMSVTVIAQDATTADALATALFVMGSERGLEFATKYKGIEVLYISENGISMTPGFKRYLLQSF